ncbi:cupredoxin domain-containing protein [Bacillus sp. ISL-7]|uniref:cupredoxin domain-containing protein n=1 Tax=Bacillus sp. ISL-7 TaxID=2819136 RepID=UPI001BEBA3E7|nr:cupredoxin domain-containing protein [Bacillus sp. ISL-7]MBT2737127.1 cupredoxin domain-containing protein [Bacillus sp. ISL-7]
MNIFAIISAIVVAIGTGYSIYSVYRHKNKLANTSGIMISMVIAVITGLLTGSIIGIISGEIFLVVGVSMIIGFVVGFLAGHPVGILAILMGSISGLMGGIIGAILGAFLQFINPTILLGILLGFYILIIGFVIMYIFVESNNKLSLDTQELSPFAIIAGGVVIVSLFLFMYSSDMVEIPGQSQTTQTGTQQAASSQKVPKTEVDVTKESKPIVKMEVTTQGYTPNVIRVKKGIPVELEIKNQLDSSNCISTFMIPHFNINNVNLKTGTTKLTFTPDKSGEYTFSCGMQMFKGTIIVE